LPIQGLSLLKPVITVMIVACWFLFHMLVLSRLSVI
jgi:hypothetical protein